MVFISEDVFYPHRIFPSLRVISHAHSGPLKGKHEDMTIVFIAPGHFVRAEVQSQAGPAVEGISGKAYVDTC